MGITSLTEAQHAQELVESEESAARLKKETFERHPNLALDANWPLITNFIARDQSVLNTANIEQAIGILLGPPPRLAVLSDVELQARQQQMADTICSTQFTRTFRPSERESWSAKLYKMAEEKRNRFLVALSRVDLMDLVEREKARPTILAAKKASRPAFDSNVILGGKQAYEAAFAAELEQLASLDIEELEKVSAPAMSLDEAKADYRLRHPEAVGSQPVHFGDEAKQFNSRSEEVENRDNPNGVVISYTRAELISMNRNEYKRLFMRPNGNGGFEYKPGYAAAIERILHGEMTEGAQLRDQALRNRI
jgi:hypothetical protein